MGVLAMMIIPGSFNTSNNEFTVYGAATLVQNDSNGEEIFSQTVHNQVVDTGEEFLLDAIFQDGATDVADNIQIGAICISDDATAVVEGLTAATFDTNNSFTEANCKEDTTVTTSGSVAKPEFYLFNEEEPSYGIVSLIVDGETVSKKSQLFGTGQTQIIFNWNVPNSDGYVTYDIQGMVELYDSQITTTSSSFATYPKTVTVSGIDMPALQVIEKDGTILADPALVYASDADSTARFTVTDPQSQCIIGSAEECLVNDSTAGKRGGLESIPYGDQILRVKYSGADNALERFSITSIDPIVGQWNVSLESEDGLIQQADASEDTVVKIKYRFTLKLLQYILSDFSKSD